MSDTFILNAVIVLVFLATAIIVISSFLGTSCTPGRASPPDQAELDKREYETMLRHRRREKNRRAFEEQNLSR